MEKKKADSEKEDDESNRKQKKKKRVPIPQLPGKFIDQYYDAMANNSRFHELFNKLPYKYKYENVYADRRILAECEGHQYRHRLWNRGWNVLPFKRNAVRLKSLPDWYINASYLQNFVVGFEHILTQDPLPETTFTFWYMVWEYAPAAIVMLCPPTTELQAKKMAARNYYPVESSGHQKHFVKSLMISSHRKPMTVRTKSVTVHPSRAWEVREIEVDIDEKQVTTLHYNYCHDYQKPLPHMNTFLKFYFEVSRSILASSTERPLRVVVHCSEGVALSGVYTLIDICLSNLMHTGGMHHRIDIEDLMTRLRSERKGFIPHSHQLRYAIRAINVGATAIKVAHFDLNDIKL